MNYWIIVDIVEIVMEQAGERLFIYHTDPLVDALLESRAEELNCRKHFSQNEEFFLSLPKAIEIPSMPIHHDVENKKPDPSRRQAVVNVIRHLVEHVPGLLTGFKWFFDATDSLRVCFYQLLRADDTVYLVLLRIDLGFRPMISTLVTPGNNDQTAIFATSRLFLDMDIVPVTEVDWIEGGALTMRILQSVSETWIGETGRGYFVQGIWLDREISKFLTRLFLPSGKRLYPYYPINCKFRAICLQPFDLSPGGRRQAVSALHACRCFLDGRVREIEIALRQADFSEELPLFKEMHAEVPVALLAYFEPLVIKSYLNQAEMKEYELSYEAK